MTKVEKVSKMSPIGKYPQTFAAIWAGIEDELKQRLTTRELALVVDSKSRSYQQGKADARAWVEDDLLGVDGKIIPLALIKSIKKREKVEKEYIPVSNLRNYLGKAGLHFYFQNNRNEFEEIDVAGFYNVMEAAEAYLRNNPDTKLYTRQTWYVDEYYIGEQLVYAERC